MIFETFAIIKNDDQRSELSEFYIDNADRFLYIALSKLHNEHDAEDAVQTAFARIADKPENFFFIPPHARIAYVDIMIRNIAIDMYNRRSKVAFKEESEDDTCNEYISLEDIVVEKISKDELL